MEVSTVKRNYSGPHDGIGRHNGLKIRGTYAVRVQVSLPHQFIGVNMMKQNFDVVRSLYESPPVYPKGVNHKERVIVKRKNIIRSFQPRNLVLEIDNIAPIKNSYEINGILYDQPVKDW